MRISLRAIQQAAQRYAARPESSAPPSAAAGSTDPRAVRVAYLARELTMSKPRALAAEAEAVAPGNQSETIKLLSQERIVGDRNDLRDINYLELAIATARGVARINLPDGYGTGVLVGPGLLMTNHHVLDSLAAASAARAEFDCQEDAQHHLLTAQLFDLSPERFFITNAELDFTVVAVAERSALGRPISDYPWTKLIGTVGKAEIGDAINIIQHPNGGLKQIAFRNNQILDIPRNNRTFLYYSTDTEPGSSGSPCYNDQWELIALHHSGVANLDANGALLKRGGSVFREGLDSPDEIDWVANEGARVSAIVSELGAAELDGEQAALRDALLNRTALNPMPLARAAGHAVETHTTPSNAPASPGDTSELYRELGYRGPIRAAALPLPRPDGAVGFAAQESARVEVLASEPPPLDPAMLEILQERLRSNPEEILKRARALWDPEIGHDDLRAAIEKASGLLRAPALGLERVRSEIAQERAAGKQLPPEFFQDWPYDPAIPIDPSSTRFETKADIANWILFGGPALIGAWFAKKAPFPWHHTHASKFVYAFDEPSPASPLRIALVSDFGTGLYHYRYNAKHLHDEKYPYVVHGGDVYYAGRESEFGSNFKPLIDPLLGRGTQVFTMNANHEMYSMGKPYFNYLKARRITDPQQVQEGSYFALRFGRTLQIVGIDTAYFRDGRFDESSLQRWLTETLRWGRQQGAVNILFSPDQPYEYGKTGLTNLLTEDLAAAVQHEQLVDLWFWGNTHYCALFDRTPTLPFIGSCIGHGGYPYTRETAGKPSAAPVRFLETGARFPAYTDIRQDRGNNGYCELSVHSDGELLLTYIDWMKRTRCRARITRPNGTVSLGVL